MNKELRDHFYSLFNSNFTHFSELKDEKYYSKMLLTLSFYFKHLDSSDKLDAICNMGSEDQDNFLFSLTKIIGIDDRDTLILTSARLVRGLRNYLMSEVEDLFNEAYEDWKENNRCDEECRPLYIETDLEMDMRCDYNERRRGCL